MEKSRNCRNSEKPER